MYGLWNRTLLIDAVIATVLTAATMITTVPAADNRGVLFDSPYGLSLIAASGMFLTLRRRWPVISTACVFIGIAVYMLEGFPYGPIFMLLATAIGTVGYETPARTALILSALIMVGHAPLSYITQTGDDPPIVNVSISVTWILLPLATGMAFRAARLARKRAKDGERRRHLADERLRIAREVHDVVGHGLAVISMHAGVALHVLDRRGGDVPAEVVDSLRTIRRSGQEALEELRATLAPLSTGEPIVRDPVPGIGGLDALIAGVSGGGLEVALTEEGEPRRLPTTVHTAAYRITQEALTNIVRHSGASRATVTIGHLPGAVELSIVDDGRGCANGAAGGHGIAGMAERARALGGELTAGPREHGGFAVRAVLPYEKLPA